MKKKNAFTLIELLAVIAVIAILTVIAVPNILKLYKESKKNIFIAQVRKVAKSSQKEYAENMNNTFDCNKDLSGNKYKECTGTIDEDEVTITALGDGAFSNFLMLDVTSEPDSGVFIDLDELNLVDIEKEDTKKENFIEDNKINSFFRSVSGTEFVNKIKEINKESIDAENEEYMETLSSLLDEMRTNYEIKNNIMSIKKLIISPNNQSVQNQSTLSNQSSEDDENILIYELNFTDNLKGTYKISNFDFEGLIIKESDIQKLFGSDTEENPSKYLITNDLTFKVDKAEKIYIALILYYGEEYSGFTIEREKSDTSLQLIGDNTININVNDVKKYNDSGIKNKGNAVTGKNDFVSYTNIREKEGNYKYYYILKTNEGVKVLKRDINVFIDTSIKCFAFELNESSNTYAITDYYDTEENDPYGKVCPREVYIPDKYNNKNIEYIGDQAFSERNINSVKFPNNLKNIGWYSFANNNIKKLYFPKTLEDLDWGVFVSNYIEYIEYYGTSKFCTQSIGDQKKNTGFGRHSVGKTSGDFLSTCPE